MKILASWLNDYLSTKVDAKTAADRLTRAGIEIEHIISSIKLDDKIIVARVNKVIQHPNADRLKLVDVDMGTKTIQVVCGAPNVAEGQLAALAQPGAILLDGTLIEKALLRGENSEGMLCSARELGLGDDHTGILVLDPTFTVGATLCDVVDLGEILDLTTAANRPDLLSALGLAREVAAGGGEVALESRVESRELRVDEHLVGEIENKHVKQYVLAHVKLQRNGESPAWMQVRLRAAGVRPISTVVDITNYVMLELGQPLHAFDASKVELPISAHSPGKEEKLTTLDGVSRSLSPDDLVILDKNGPIALAGLMGGSISQITAGTTAVYLEAANFDGPTVRKMAVRHGLRTDASARFERNLPLPLADLGMRRALELLEEFCGAEPVSISSDDSPLLRAEVLEVSLDRINSLLGIEVIPDQAAKLLENLGFEVRPNGRILILSLPWWRTDVTCEADIVEEIGRSLGYDNLPATLPAWSPREVEFDQYWPRLWQLKATLRGLGLDEVVTYSFVSQKQLDDFGHDTAKHLKLKNPLSSEQAYLRSSLAPSLVATVARNARNFGEFGIYEISKVYIAGSSHAEQPDEPIRLAVAWRSDDAYLQVKNVLDTLARDFAQFKITPAKNLLFANRRSAQIVLDDQPIGLIGEVHKNILNQHKLNGRVGYLETDVLPWLTNPTAKKVDSVSRFPSIVRDLSIVVKNNISWSKVEEIVHNAKIDDVTFLSDYYGSDLEDGTKGVALRLTFASAERTLTDDEADTATAKVMDALTRELGATQRV